jgi:hypothetical protein
MNITVHLLAYNEEWMIPYSLRHYKTFASKIILHDLGSRDATCEIARAEGCEIRDYDTHGETNDMLNKQIKQNEWKGVRGDWVIMADMDELIYFPAGSTETLSAYDTQGLAVAKPHGYEMFSETTPSGSGQIYDEVKHGGRDDQWYAKPILLSPNRCRHVEFSTGAHSCEVTLHSGHKLRNPEQPSVPACYLLHFHHVHPIERIAAKYDAHRARMSAMNKQYRWGNFEPGIKHAQDKRNVILSRLERVIA